MLASPEAAEAVDSHAFWTGRLSMSIACFLASRMDKSDLRAAYREFMRSPACAPEVRAMLRNVCR
jgi:hypothetical protein